MIIEEPQDQRFRRVSLLVTNEQYARVQAAGLNLSGLVRDLLDFRFSEKRILLTVSEQTKALYDEAISNFGATDAQLEGFFLEAIEKLLAMKLSELENLRTRVATQKRLKTASSSDKLSEEGLDPDPK